MPIPRYPSLQEAMEAERKAQEELASRPEDIPKQSLKPPKSQAQASSVYGGVGKGGAPEYVGKKTSGGPGFYGGVQPPRGYAIDFEPTGGGGGGKKYGGRGGGSIKPLVNVKWKKADFNIKHGNAPSWWTGLVPASKKDASRPDVQQLMFLNTLIPYLSPEDQRRAALQLFSVGGPSFARYDPDKLGEAQIPLGRVQALLSERGGPTVDREYYFSKGRATGAEQALGQLNKYLNKTGKKTAMPAANWLRALMGVTGAYGEDGLTKAEQLAMMGELDPLLAQGESEAIGPAAAIGQMLAQPFFSQTELFPRYKDPTGRVRFGTPNPLLME